MNDKKIVVIYRSVFLRLFSYKIRLLFSSPINFTQIFLKHHIYILAE